MASFKARCALKCSVRKLVIRQRKAVQYHGNLRRSLTTTSMRRTAAPAYLSSDKPHPSLGYSRHTTLLFRCRRLRDSYRWKRHCKDVLPTTSRHLVPRTRHAKQHQRVHRQLPRRMLLRLRTLPLCQRVTTHSLSTCPWATTVCVAPYSQGFSVQGCRVESGA